MLVLAAKNKHRALDKLLGVLLLLRTRCLVSKYSATYRVLGAYLMCTNCTAERREKKTANPTTPCTTA